MTCQDGYRIFVDKRSGNDFEQPSYRAKHMFSAWRELEYSDAEIGSIREWKCITEGNATNIGCLDDETLSDSRKLKTIRWLWERRGGPVFTFAGVCGRTGAEEELAAPRGRDRPGSFVFANNNSLIRHHCTHKGLGYTGQLMTLSLYLGWLPFA